MDPILSTLCLIDLLTQIAAVGGPFHLCTLHLGKNPLVVNRGTLLAAFTEADFDGYAEVPGLVFTAPYIDQVGNVRMDTPSADFQTILATIPQTIYTWYLTDAGGTNLRCAGEIDPPVNLANPLDGFRVQPTYTYGN